MTRKMLNYTLGPALAAIALLFIMAGPAFALSPWSHLVMTNDSWPEVAEFLKIPDDSEHLEACMMGAIAVDSGYYPGGHGDFANLVHLYKSWDYCRTLFDEAANSRERAFAAGWLGHAILDAIAHGELVNPTVGGVYNVTKLAHKQLEWGLDCYVLAQPRNSWLWDVQLKPQGFELCARSLKFLYGDSPPADELKPGMKGIIYEVDRLPRVFWLSGNLDRPDSWAGNSLGWVMNWTLVPVYTTWLEVMDGDINILAILTPTRPTPGRIEQYHGIMEKAARLWLAALKGGIKDLAPNLDVDPGCADEKCPDINNALKWLHHETKP